MRVARHDPVRIHLGPSPVAAVALAWMTLRPLQRARVVTGSPREIDAGASQVAPRMDPSARRRGSSHRSDRLSAGSRAPRAISRCSDSTARALNRIRCAGGRTNLQPGASRAEPDRRLRQPPARRAKNSGEFGEHAPDALLAPIVPLFDLVQHQLCAASICPSSAPEIPSRTSIALVDFRIFGRAMERRTGRDSSRAVRSAAPQENRVGEGRWFWAVRSRRVRRAHGACDSFGRLVRLRRTDGRKRGLTRLQGRLTRVRSARVRSTRSCSISFTIAPVDLRLQLCGLGLVRTRDLDCRPRRLHSSSRNRM